MIVMMLCPQPSYENYWMNNHPFYGNLWIKDRMSKNKFLEMLQCVDDDPDELFNFANDLFADIWVPHIDISLDEMMIPFKGKCPHHVLIKRKPNPNGMKVWCVADEKKFAYHVDLYKRTSVEFELPVIYGGKNSYERFDKLPPESTTETALRMVSFLPCLSYNIFCDSYFGSLELADRLSDLGFGCTLVCRKDRPRWLFQFTNDCSHPEKFYSAIGQLV